MPAACGNPPAELRQIVSGRGRAERGHHEQRCLPGLAAEPVPREHAGLIGPLQIFRDDDKRAGGAQPAGKRQHPLDPGEHRIAGEYMGALTPVISGVATWLALSGQPALTAKALSHQPERELPVKFIGRRPRYPASDGRGRQRPFQQGSLADSLLTLDKDGSARSRGHPG